MTKGQKYQFIWMAIFAVALALRFGLALVNREANDDHLEAVRLILKTGQLPVMGACRECFHPKLYYITAAALLQGFDLQEVEAQTILLQILNLYAGALTLAVVYRFIKNDPSEHEPVKLLAFALIALNPKLIAIHSQVSNDTFVILFSTLTLFWTERFLKKPARGTFALLVLFCLLTVATKATGWIIFLAVFLSLLAASSLGAEKKRLAGYTALFLTLTLGLTALNPLAQFGTNYQKFGAPIVTRDKQLPLPGFFQPTSHYKDYHFRPGIVSIQDGFFTFKLIDLLKVPLIPNGQYNYPPTRTSFWTMLYADAHSLHFQNWPVSWGSQDEANFTVSRGIFVLALLPTLIFAAGFLLAIIRWVKTLVSKKRENLATAGDSLFLLTGGGCLAFLLLAALLYRDFAFIKLVYILPGLLAFAWLFLRGADRLFALFSARFRPGRWLLSGWVGLLLGFYVWDVLAMISQLYTANIHF
jgi:hypothetical protein